MPRRLTTYALTPSSSPPPHAPLEGAVRRPAPRLRREVEEVLAYWRTSPEHTEQTRLRLSETVTRFKRRLAATGVASLNEVASADAEGFVLALTRFGAPPELSTQHARRTALRTLFRTARRLGLSGTDPTLDLQLPPRGSLAARPLLDDEVTLCRASALMTRGADTTLRAAAWALGETGAVSSEITTIRIQDLDDPRHPTDVRLPGTRRHDPRVAPLTQWGRLVLAERVAHLRAAGASDSTLIAYGGRAPAGEAKAQAAACNALRDVLNAAGLLAEPDVRPASLRNWAGRRAYDAGSPLEEVARLLGLRSLDAAAEDIALTWRTAAPTTACTTAAPSAHKGDVPVFASGPPATPDFPRHPRPQDAHPRLMTTGQELSR